MAFISIETKLNKSFFTNATAFFLVLISFFVPQPMKGAIADIGFFALSGAITNWIAIHMLFERVPGFYGSGVIENRFQELKFAIKRMIQEQFFTKHHLQSILAQESDVYLAQIKKLSKILDYEQLYDSLQDAILGSSLGSMLQMFGGQKTLEVIKPKFTEKMEQAITTHLESDQFKDKLAQAIDQEQMTEILQTHLEKIIDSRLEQMTPKMIKILMKQMMEQHLGWLVVWGGVFGGLLGLLKTITV
ncbi:MAG TPA: DUF445 domain-containing protein [Gammaproteobacteria bacterium]|nr:DUF445 domain-containing protein [Gammaproteobacteria bacterium]